jgi:hypothetical protein
MTSTIHRQGPGNRQQLAGDFNRLGYDASFDKNSASIFMAEVIYFISLVQ